MSATQIFPELDSATEAALRASIERFGVLVPVVLDQHGQILDGHHRVRLAGEIGVECETKVREVADDAEAHEIARTLNADRRHLTVLQRREVVAVLREEGHSLRAIGGALKVDPMTVKRDLDEVGVAPSTPITGRDGKVYPATQPKPAKPFEIKSKRGEIVAEANKRKLDGALARINGYCRGLADFRLDAAIAGASPEDLAAWGRLAGEAASVLTRLKRAIKEAE